jgi:tryptophan synthase alpha chain
MSRLAATFDDLGARSGKGLVAYVTSGDPDQARSEAVVRGAVRGGADVIELGVPFSDPIADGPAIQRATERSLAAGGSLTRTLDLVHALRADLDVPIVLFTYVNPVLRYGVPAFVAKAADAGVDGVLLLDLPIEESAPLQSALASRGIDPILGASVLPAWVAFQIRVLSSQIPLSWVLPLRNSWTQWTPGQFSGFATRFSLAPCSRRYRSRATWAGSSSETGMAW